MIGRATPREHIAPGRFELPSADFFWAAGGGEPRSAHPKSAMLDHYTTGLLAVLIYKLVFNF